MKIKLCSHYFKKKKNFKKVEIIILLLQIILQNYINQKTMNQILKTYEQTVSSLSHLLKVLEQHEINHIYLLCGNEHAGKKTFIHYLMEKQLQSQFDEEEQEILQIIQPLQPTVIMQNFLSVYAHQDSKTVYIWMNGFKSQNQDVGDEIKMAITFQYLSKILISHQSDVKFLLVFSLFEEDLPQLILNFKNNFKIYSHFQSRSAFILSKLMDQSEKEEFNEQTVPNMVEANDELMFIEQIIQLGQVYPFYNRSSQLQEQKQMKLKVDGIQCQSSLEYSEEFINNYLKRIISGSTQENNEIKSQFLQFSKNRLNTCFKVLSASLALILLNIAIMKPPQSFDRTFEECLKEVILKKVSFSPNKQLLEKEEERKNFFAFYQKSQQIYQNDPSNFVHFLMQQIDFIQQFWSQQSLECGVLEKMKIYFMVFSLFNEDQKATIDLTIFQPNQSYTSNFIISKVFSRVKGYLSAEFLQKNEEMLKSPLKGKQKRIIKKNRFDSYVEQKKKASTLSIDKILALPQSPLKIDLLLEELQKARKEKKRNFRDQRILNKLLTNMLLIYKEYEAVIKLASIIPDFRLIQISLVELIEQIEKSGDSTKKDVQFIDNVVKYYYLNRKHQTYDLKIAIEFLSKKVYKTKESLQIFQESMKRLLQKKGKTIFMNYELAESLFSDKNRIVEKCLDYEEQNWKRGSLANILIFKDELTIPTS